MISIPEIVSCQNINGNRQKIDKVEVVDSASERSDIGKVKLDTMTQQNVEMTPERKSRVKELKKKREALVKQGRHSKNNNYGSMIMGKPALCSTRVDAVNLQNQTPTVVDKNFIYMPSTVEISPNFPGGISKFYEYFNSNFKVPIQNKNIKLIFSFVVDTDGSLVKIKLLRGINETLDKRAIEVVKASPKWIPGELSGQKVKVSYALPIKITP